MKKHWPSFYISPFTILYFGLIFVLNRYYYIFLYLISAFIHEAFHIITSIIFKVKVSKFSILPFGFYAKIDELEDVSLIKQILIIISGPLSIFFSLALFKFLYKLNIISIYGYNHSVLSAYSVLFFNLLPIYPLDGNRLINAIIGRFFEESVTKIIVHVISLTFLIFFGIYLIKIRQIIVFIFLISNNFLYLFNSFKNYQNFLLVRYIKTPPAKVKLSLKPRIFRHFHNYFLNNDKIVEEKQIIKIKLKKLHQIKSFFNTLFSKKKNFRSIDR